MKATVSFILLALGFPGAVSPVQPADIPNIDASPTSALLYPLVALPSEGGTALPLFSLAAYRAEVRHLSAALHRLDLKGDPVKTDGWTANIAEAEWPWLACAYFGYACANLAVSDSAHRREYLEEMRWLIEAMQTPRLSGFMTPHFGPPFAKEIAKPSAFVHGHFLNLAVRYRQVSGDARYDPVLRRVANALHGAYETNSQGLLASYRDMWWISDNLPALSALARYDRIFHAPKGDVAKKFLRSCREWYLDPRTRLFATYVEPNYKQIMQGPRGISTMYGLHFLKDVDPGVAREQYDVARRVFVRQSLGMAAVREFPEHEAEHSRGDIDSGPVIFGFGPSASGFAIAAAAVMGDESTAQSLLLAAVLAGMPEWREGRLRYTIMPPVGQAVILFGKTELLKRQSKAEVEP